MKSIFLTIFFLFWFIFYSSAQVITDSAFVHHQIVHGIDYADYIFEGEVISQQSYYNPEHNFIYTSNSVKVNQSWKTKDGKPFRERDIVEVITRGGTVGDTSLSISHNLNFRVGQRGMFLTSDAVYPTNPNPSQALKLQLYDGLFFNYDYTKHYINASYSSFNFDCIDLLYKTIDPTYVVECLDVYPNGFLQAIKYGELAAQNQLRLAESTSGDADLTFQFENAATVIESGQEYFEFDVFLSFSKMYSLRRLECSSNTIRMHLDRPLWLIQT